MSLCTHPLLPLSRRSIRVQSYLAESATLGQYISHCHRNTRSSLSMVKKCGIANSLPQQKQFTGNNRGLEVIHCFRKSPCSKYYSTRARGKLLDQADMHPLKRAFIAFGSNVGDRLANIEEACRSLETGGTISIRRSSGLWQTKAMYVTDQNDFLNGVLEVKP